MRTQPRVALCQPPRAGDRPVRGLLIPAQSPPRPANRQEERRALGAHTSETAPYSQEIEKSKRAAPNHFPHPNIRTVPTPAQQVSIASSSANHFPPRTKGRRSTRRSVVSIASSSANHFPLEAG